MTVQPTALTLPAQELATVVQSEATALRGLDDWLHAAASAQQLAQQLVHSFFVPQAYKPGNPRDEAAVGVAVANATGAILLGQSLGLDPLTALQQIYVVHGRPGMYSKMKVALAQAAGHRVWDEEYTPEAATVCGQRHGTDDVVRIRVTMEDAKRAGWTTNAAYQKTPADMLWARAASRVVDRIAADLLMGIRSIEDIDPDEAPAQVAQVTVEDVTKGRQRGGGLAALPTRALSPSSAPAEAPAAAAPPIEAPAEAPSTEAPDAPSAIDEKTWRQINTRFVEIGGQVRGLTGPGQSEARMRVVCHIIDRRVTKGSELTAQEGYDVASNLAGGSGVELCRSVLAPAAGETPAAAAVEHAATVDEQIAAARADADARDAQRAAEQAQADEIDPTMGEEWPA